MSDTVTSGEPAVAPAETPSAPPTGIPANVFGTSRGSGLARGKRASAPASAADKPVGASDYKPTAVQVITSEREYRNPFESKQPALTSAVADAPTEPSRVNPPVEESIATSVISNAAPEELSAVSTPPIPVAGFGGPVVRNEPAVKVELKILPPEEKTRPAQSWESSSFPPAGEQQAASKPSDSRPQNRREREERPVFRPERHEQRQNNNSPAQHGEDSREPRRDDSREPRRDGPREGGPRQEGRERREPRPMEPKAAPPPPSPVPTAEVSKKSGGFFVWLKGLFSGRSVEKPSVSPTPVEQPSDERPFDDPQRRRRHRGGRGRNQQGGFRNENRGPQDSQPGGDASHPGNPGDQNRGERKFDGGKPRRHRGGGGRGRGGYRGGERRPEGGDQQDPS